MITFPDHLVPTYREGYYWCIKTQQLYSIKVDGRLTPLKRMKRSKFVHWCSRWYYSISVNGVSKTLTDDYLLGLNLKKFKKEQVLKVHRNDNDDSLVRYDKLDDRPNNKHRSNPDDMDTTNRVPNYIGQTLVEFIKGWFK